MAHKYCVGQAVEYKPIGAQIGYYKVIRQMPEEFQAVDRRYRIKSVQEGFERNVLECQLSSDVSAESEYATIKPRLAQGSRAT